MTELKLFIMEILEMFKIGYINPFWNDEYKLLPFVRQPFNNQDDINYWRSLGFTQEHFTGELFSVFEKGTLQWADKFFDLFKGQFTSLNFYKMNTCDILPYHRDTYQKFKDIHNLDSSTTITRALVFLENRKEGHIFEVDGKIIDWQAGNYVLWTNDEKHMAANLGSDPRYTAQITFLDV